MLSRESCIPTGSESGKCLNIHLIVETTGTLALPGSFAHSDPPHFPSAVFRLWINAVSAFRESQRAADVERKVVPGERCLDGAPPHCQRSGLLGFLLTVGSLGSRREGQALPEARSACWRRYALCQCPLCSREALAALLLHLASQLRD